MSRLGNELYPCFVGVVSCHTRKVVMKYPLLMSLGTLALCCLLLDACTSSGRLYNSPSVVQPQKLFVAGYGNNTVTEYAPPYTGAPIAMITNSLSAPVGLGFNASGDLFVGNDGNNTVTEYASPYTSAPMATTTISNSYVAVEGVAFNASGDLFVSTEGNNTVTEYASPYKR
jgi:hypothetical protein